MRIYLEEVFHEVADLNAAARSRYFAEHAIDEQTRKEVEALLAFDSPSSMLLEKNIGRVALKALARVEPAGLTCGPYRLGRLLGRGGMGNVYAAVRIDGEVTQEVAVKLLRPDPTARSIAAAFWRSVRFWPVCLIRISPGCSTLVIERMASPISPWSTWKGSPSTTIRPASTPGPRSSCLLRYVTRLATCTATWWCIAI